MSSCSKTPVARCRSPVSEWVLTGPSDADDGPSSWAVIVALQTGCAVDVVDAADVVRLTTADSAAGTG